MWEFLAINRKKIQKIGLIVLGVIWIGIGIYAICACLASKNEIQKIALSSEVEESSELYGTEKKEYFGKEKSGKENFEKEILEKEKLEKEKLDKDKTEKNKMQSESHKNEKEGIEAKEDGNNRNENKGNENKEEKDEKVKEDETSNQPEGIPMGGDAIGDVTRGDELVGDGPSSDGSVGTGEKSEQSSSTSKINKPVEPQWIFIGSKKTDLITDEQKQYMDGLMQNWIAKNCTDEELATALEEYIEGNGIADKVAYYSGVRGSGNCRYLAKSIEDEADGESYLNGGYSDYQFYAVYTDGEYDDMGYLICYNWSMGF